MRNSGKNDKRRAALLEYHARRPGITRNRLMEALDRMEADATVIIPSHSKPNQKNLTLEAGVSESTLISRDPETGERRYADILARLRKLQQAKIKPAAPKDYAEQKIQELRDANKALKEDRYNQAIEIDRLGMLLLEKKEEIKRLEEIEAQNAQLREEIRKMKYGSPKNIK